MEWSKFWLYVLVMAGVTYLIRMLPLAAIRGKVKSRFVQAFLYYVPYAVLGAMTIPAVFSSTGSLPGAIAGVVAAAVLGWMGKGLLTVAAAACVAAYVAAMFLH
ncbi:MAG: AzlD domain-containing protein [Clostridia bacterium]|nr:AzlD domain-containing protein [Clostridia bacterium]